MYGVAGVLFLINYAISVELLWAEDGGRCLHVSKSLASMHFQAMGEQEVGGEPLWSKTK